MPNLAKDKYCTGCLACKDKCSNQAINIIMKNGLVFPYINQTKCIECHACEKACPIIIPQHKNNVEEMRVYGGWASDSETRYKGASGGAFGGLAQSFIKAHQGDVSVYGATLNNNQVLHRRITTLEEVYLLMNSKYIQSSTDGIYNKVRTDLVNGLWVLFSGTPCQVAALYAYLGKKRYNNRLLTIEIICHGIPGKEALDIHLQHFHSNAILSFRNKEDGWKTSQCTTIEYKGKPYRLKRKEDVFYKIFAGWILDRKSCSNCKYSSLNRIADITLGDFWGGGLSFQESEKGVNVIIANNLKADAFIKESTDVEIHKSTLGKVIGGNPNLYCGYKYIQYHPVVMWPTFFRKMLPRNIWLHIVKNDMPYKLFWAIFKIPTILHYKRKEIQIRRKYKSFLHTIFL